MLTKYLCRQNIVGNVDNSCAGFCHMTLPKVLPNNNNTVNNSLLTSNNKCGKYK